MPPKHNDANDVNHKHNANDINFVAGLFSGAVVAVALNPWDRALYLSVTKGRPFLCLDNFRQPYQGFGQAFVHRTLSQGSYFPLLDFFKGPCEAAVRRYCGFTDPRVSAAVSSFLGGNMAGATNGIVFNSLSSVKYHAWTEGCSFSVATKRMWQQGGYRPFVNGILATICRDSVFGGLYALLKFLFYDQLSDEQRGKQQNRLMVEVTAGCLATVASSPFNYARNIKYSSPPNVAPPKVIPTILGLFRHAASHTSPISYLQHNLGIGWGTARVGVGMAFAHELYTITQHRLESFS